MGGMKWAKGTGGSITPATDMKQYNTQCYSRAQLLLSKKFLGFFLVPDDSVWNYNMMGVRWSNTIEYKLVVGRPLEFFDPKHRPMHFIAFSDNKDDNETYNVDVQDPF